MARHFWKPLTSTSLVAHLNWLLPSRSSRRLRGNSPRMATFNGHRITTRCSRTRTTVDCSLITWTWSSRNYNDFEIDYGLLAAHKETVTNELKEHKGDEDVRWKYQWLATYHNYICRAFAKRFPIPSHEDASPEYLDLCALAQQARNYLVQCEELLPPRPLKPQRLLRQ